MSIVYLYKIYRWLAFEDDNLIFSLKKMFILCIFESTPSAPSYQVPMGGEDLPPAYTLPTYEQTNGSEAPPAY